MTKYLLLFLLPFSLYASKILSYNIYERTDRADVMITFDTPYSGSIKKSVSKSKIVIKLGDATIESSKNKKVTSKFLHHLTISPMKNQTLIVASISPFTKLVASKTSDSYGLRLRFITKTSVKTKDKTTVNNFRTDLSALPTKKGVQISSRYYIVVGILIIGIIILLMLKKRMQLPKKEQKNKNSWLFKSTEATQINKTTDKTDNNSVSIRFQKSINDSSSVVMLDFSNQSYLVLMGNNNILLDKFNDDKPTSQKEFESVLQDRHEELEDFLGKEPLQAYKERAASLIYEENS